MYTTYKQKHKEAKQHSLILFSDRQCRGKFSEHKAMVDIENFRHLKVWHLNF